MASAPRQGRAGGSARRARGCPRAALRPPPPLEASPLPISKLVKEARKSLETVRVELPTPITGFVWSVTQMRSGLVGATSDESIVHLRDSGMWSFTFANAGVVKRMDIEEVEDVIVQPSPASWGWR